MAESRYKKGVEYDIYRLTNPLIRSLCNLSETSVNYKRAEEFILSNLKYHTFLEPLHADVSTTYASIIEKLKINSQTQKADRLQELFTKFLKMKLLNPKGVIDLNVRLLDLLLKLSTAPLESTYMPPKAFRKPHEPEIVIDDSSPRSASDKSDFSENESENEDKNGSDSSSEESEWNLDSSVEEIKVVAPAPEKTLAVPKKASTAGSAKDEEYGFFF